jgi:selenide,water dikinase
VYRLNESTALIQTVDFFTPIVDDPHAFGRITAANALSDVYAMGGKPLLCMNILACPVKTMEHQVFRDIIEGGLAKIKEAGALLVGGHSIEDDELKYGLSVTGIVHPDHVLLNSGALPGDVLVLTKPLGTGILSTALKGGLADSQVEQQIVEVMATLNRLPAEIVGHEDFAANPELAAHSCTDITGFGLLGHLHEMAEASGVSMRVQAKDLPVLVGAIDYINMGIIPEGAYTNQKYYQQWISSTLDKSDPLAILGFDPQTSGGLLFSLPFAGAERLLSELSGQDGPGGWVIGEVLSGDKGRIQLV